MVKVRSLERVPFVSYFHFCNVLYIWSVWVIPTYRVYRHYDIFRHVIIRCLCKEFILLYAGDVQWGMDHFSEVLDLIWDARSSYQGLGYGLGLSPATINAIKQSNFHNTENCFDKILEEALKNGLSRNKLAKVLESKTMGYGQLAKKVRAANFCKLYYLYTWSIYRSV